MYDGYFSITFYYKTAGGFKGSYSFLLRAKLSNFLSVWPFVVVYDTRRETSPLPTIVPPPLCILFEEPKILLPPP